MCPRSLGSRYVLRELSLVFRSTQTRTCLESVSKADTLNFSFLLPLSAWTRKRGALSLKGVPGAGWGVFLEMTGKRSKAKPVGSLVLKPGRSFQAREVE